VGCEKKLLVREARGKNIEGGEERRIEKNRQFLFHPEENADSGLFRASIPESTSIYWPLEEKREKRKRRKKVLIGKVRLC